PRRRPLQHDPRRRARRPVPARTASPAEPLPDDARRRDLRLPGPPLARPVPRRAPGTQAGGRGRVTLLLPTTAILVAISLVLAFLVQGGFSRRRRTASGFWRRLWIRQALLLPVYVFVVVPGIFGFVGSRIVGTRG